MSDLIVQNAIESLRGQIAWNVRKGHGIFVTMDFGVPRLEVREPLPDARSPSLRRRRVTVAGDWHIWTYMCDWTILDGDAVLAGAESADSEIDAACAVINGQILQDIQINAGTATSTFIFDEGGRLVTSRGNHEANVEQWLTYNGDAFLFAFRNDGSFTFEN